MLGRIEYLLEQQRKTIIQRGSHSLAYESPLWFVVDDARLEMFIYNRGSFWIDRRVNGSLLKYDLSCLHGFLFCLIICAGFFMFALAAGDITSALMFALFVFCWLYGMNMLLAWWRIPKMIQTAVNPT